VKLISKIVLGAAVSLTLALNAAMAADALQLPELMQLLAQNKSGKATFVEKKYIGILNRPVVSTGELAFAAPGQLEKRTLTPEPETVVLNGGILTIDQPGRQRKIVSLGDHPEVTAFIESIRGTLTGDLAELQAYYKLDLTGSAEKWLLVLTPKQERLSRIFSHIAIGGSGADVRNIEIDQRDGDRSVMTITKVSVVR
jgi:outer membrane lipoprotein-sorting protein